MLGALAAEVMLIHAVLVAERLQLAGGAAHAGETVLLVVGEQQLEIHLSRLHDAGRVRGDLHTLVYGVNAGGDHAARTLDLDEAEAAGADLIDVLQIAKCRDVDAGIARSLENGDALFDRVIFAVDFDVDSFHSSYSFHFLSIAPNLHFAMQAPHFRHFSASMTCGVLTVPLIAPAGHTRAQAVQPLHFAGSIV